MNDVIKKRSFGFDILRVLAIFMVVIFHFFEEAIPCGIFGVVIFFVLAGFFSMREIVYNDYQVGIKQGIKKILLKIGKLYPALLIVMIVVNILMMSVGKNYLNNYYKEALGSLFFVNNFIQVFNNESYFEVMSSIKPLTHLWALGIEFQFYLIFYIFVYPFYNKKRKKFYITLFVLIILFSLVLNVYYILQENEIMLYYDTFVRIYPFFLGSIVAIIGSEIERKNIDLIHINILKYFLTFLLLLLIFIRNNSIKYKFISMIYFTMILALCFLLYYITENDNKYINKIMVGISYIAKRGYYIYLVYFATIVFFNIYFSFHNINYPFYIVLNIVSIIIFAEILYLFDINIKKSKKIHICFIVFMIVLNISMIYIGKKIYNESHNEIYIENTNQIFNEVVNINNSDNISTNSNVINEATISEIENDDSVIAAPEGLDLYNLPLKFDYSDILDPAMCYKLRYVDRVNQYIGEDFFIAKEEYIKYSSTNVSIIGDSMGVCAKGALTDYFSSVHLDAKSLRSFEDAYPVLLDMKNNDILGDVVILVLGTNAPHGISEEILDIYYNTLKGKKIIFMSYFLSNPIKEYERNKLILDFVINHENCYLANWYAVAKEHKEVLQEDNIHTFRGGNQVFAHVLFKTMVDSFR